ncbi:hypothetical protein ASD15_00205 [Massilia sp. Root351]|jgi:hypothetical protein|uniref:hypothetical protein n=1 Tax=Massilia sp. Root351 TaxID=1736522 RepID=UPI00070BE18E|nr:hypothetical protein [Massilia sp. Root351]KQV90555.1 hypothetical protein ASD15_00205 [Massilia sp. Root351]
MLASEFTAAIAENTRIYQGKLESCDQRTADASRDQTALEQKIAGLLRQVASLHLEGGQNIAAEVERELAFRADEWQALRAELQTVNSDVANHVAAIRQRGAEIREAALRPGAHLDAAQVLQAARERYQRAEDAHQALLAMNAELETEIVSKLAGYRSDPLYVFLREAGYRTADYRRSGAQTVKDDWIAGLCNFDANRRNENILLAMQQALPARAERSAQALADARAQLDALSFAPPPPTIAERIAQAVAPLEAALAQADERLRRVRAGLAEYAACTDARYRRAQELQAASLKSLPIAELIAQARATPSPEDDKLVLEVVNLQDKLAGSRRDYERALAARQHAEEDAQRAEALEADLRRGGFIDTREIDFRDGLDLPPLIGRYMNGELSLGGFTLELQQFARELRPKFRYSETAWGSGSSRS